MLTAITKNGLQLIATETHKDRGPFFCPECGSQVRLKKGSHRVHHFAHIEDTACTFGAGESDIHRQAKLNVRDLLLESRRTIRVDIEFKKPHWGVRPDVIFKREDGQVCTIEIQKSYLSYKDIVMRTIHHNNLGFAVAWVSVLGKNQYEKGLDEVRLKSTDFDCYRVQCGQMIHYCEATKKLYNIKMDSILRSNGDWGYRVLRSTKKLTRKVISPSSHALTKRVGTYQDLPERLLLRFDT